MQKRFKGVKLYLWVTLWLGIFIGYQLLAGILPLYMWIPGMIGAVLLIFAFLYSSIEMNIMTAIYYVIHAFIMAEFTASLEWQIYYFYLNQWGDSLIVSYIFMIVIYTAIFGGIYALELRYRPFKRKFIVSYRDLLTVFTIGFLVFFVSNLSFTGIESPFTGQHTIEIFYIRTLVDFLGIILFYVLRENKKYIISQMELSTLNNLLTKHYQQYTISQESIRLVNQKYHDMKHQINLIKNEQNLEKRGKYLSDLEEEIKIYETLYKTGYDVLDTVLQSKGLRCIELNIKLNVVADGNILRFMNTMDLVSIFGNLIDNAIDSVRQIEDTDKRLIHIAVFKHKNVIIIRCENYFEHQLKYDDGMIVTTKKDKTAHGYGIRSITNIVHKYQGTTKINTDNNWFKFICMIPYSQEN